MFVVKEAGYAIPEQTSFVGFYAELHSSYLMPNLTSAWQPVLEMPMLSARILLKNMAEVVPNKAEVLHHEILKPELVFIKKD